MAEGAHVAGDLAAPGDKVILSGSLGDHGVAIMSYRAGLEFETAIISDSAPLHGLVGTMLESARGAIRVLRDPTRGGPSATLNEIAQQSAVGFQLDESALPVKPEVQGACELLGLDPLNVANEGKLVAIVASDAAERVVEAMRKDSHGRESQIIGSAIEDPMRLVRLTTRIGGERVVDWLAGEQLPRDLLAVQGHS